MNIKILAVPNELGADFSITISNMEPGGKIYVCNELNFVPHVLGVTANVCSISNESATQLMNDFWAAGIRPTVPSGNTVEPSQLLETNDDYKKILFSLLGILERMR